MITVVPQPDEWVRFQHHARRVVKVAVRGAETSEGRFLTHSTAFEVLQDHYPQPALLPNLQHLEWLDDEAASYASMFIQPTLRRINFQPQATEHLRSILSAIEAHAPDILELQLTDMFVVLEQVRAELSQTICALHCLEKPQVVHVPLESDAVIHLSQLPRLLEASLLLDDDNADALDFSVRDRFPALQEHAALAVTYDGSDTAERMALHLESIASPTLNSVVANICFTTPPPSQSMERLFVSMAHFEHLWRCKIVFVSPPADYDPFPADILSPLLVLRKITVFELFHPPIELTRDVVRDMLQAWPNLRSMTLHIYAHTQLELEDLILFAEHSSALDKLSVHVRDVPVNWAFDVDADLRPSALSALCLGKTFVPHTAKHAVAEFLARVFPGAELSHFHTRSSVRGAYAGSVLDGVRKLKADLVKQPRLGLSQRARID